MVEGRQGRRGGEEERGRGGEGRGKEGRGGGGEGRGKEERGRERGGEGEGRGEERKGGKHTIDPYFDVLGNILVPYFLAHRQKTSSLILESKIKGHSFCSNFLLDNVDMF